MGLLEVLERLRDTKGSIQSHTAGLELGLKGNSLKLFWPPSFHLP